MRLEIRYLNEFLYSQPAWESHNLLRACPTNDGHQRLVSYRVEVAPATRVHSYTDYWGTRVDEFGVKEPHYALSVCAESVVETAPPPRPGSNLPLVALEALAEGHSTYLRRSPHASWDQVVGDAAGEAIAGSGGITDAVLAIHELVAGSLRYEPGATYVGMDVTEVMKQGKGVCQDFSHLAIAMYRSVGIPARYVSGYLYAADQTVAIAPEEPELAVQTHAWVEVMVPEHGWWALDPTNSSEVGELHVKIGHGRDYEDVMPLRGVYHGGSDHDLGVDVRITREHLAEMTDQ